MAENKKTVLGVSENLEGLLCYVLGWVTGVIFLLLEKENKFIRFHAMQSLVAFLVLFVLSVTAGSMPFIGPLVSVLLFPVTLILWIVLMYKAYQGEKYKLPVIGDFAEKQVSK